MTDGKIVPAMSPAMVPLRYRRTVTVVDEADNFLGFKAWSDLTSDDIHRASYLWVTNSRGQVLLAQRAYTLEHNPGRWSTAVTGTVMIGQTYESNIRDEAAEEIGLKGVTFELGKKILMRLPKGSHFIQWFTVVIDRDVDSFVLDPREVVRLRWVDLDELAREVEKYPSLFSPAVPKWLPMWLS